MQCFHRLPTARFADAGSPVSEFRRSVGDHRMYVEPHMMAYTGTFMNVLHNCS